MLDQIVVAGAAVKSYEIGALLLKKLAEVEVSPRHVNNLTRMVGVELAQACAAQTATYQEQPLPRRPTPPATPMALAMVACDGGRMQTRQAGAGRGVHEPHWRETKNAGFFRMQTQSYAEDPHPQLPRVFADRQHMSRLLGAVSEVEEPAVDLTQPVVSKRENWRPEVLFRTCLSSLDDSDSFGWKMAAEADARGFYAARRRAYLGDGQPYNWTIQQAHFPSFVPILDFIHPLQYLHQAAVEMAASAEAAWSLFQKWAEQTWQGRVGEVIQQLREQLAKCPLDDQTPRQNLTATLNYLENNQSRMDYPRYRREGLPVTSALIESLIKEVNYRVKGTEKFWNDDPRGEAILYVRAALLCDDNRLQCHLETRPGSPYARTRPATASIAV